MSEIHIFPTHCSITNENDTEFLWSLDHELSYLVQGHEYMPAFKGYYKDGQFIKWNGRINLLKENLDFPIGLFQRVEEFYQSNDRPVQIIDHRPPKSSGQIINISKKLQELNKNPYYYQLQTAEATLKYDHGIIRLPTGSGKSLVAALIISNFGKTANLYVIGKDLLYQFYHFFQSVFDQPIGIIGDGKCDIQDINIVSIWTVGQALGMKKNKILLNEDSDEKELEPEKYQKIRDLLKATKVHIIDECHISSCDTIQTFSKYINPEHIYGMSASPDRDDNSNLLIESILGKYIINISASQLIEEGYLVKPYIKFLNVPYENKVKKNYQTIYKACIVENEYRNNLITKGASKMVEQGYPTLVLFNNIHHGDILYNKISKNMPCILLSGKDDVETRLIAKQKLESGEIKCLIASKILDIGFDAPLLSGLIVAGSGKSSIRALQRIGRVIRKYPNKKQAAILDFLDQAPFIKDHAQQRKNIYSREEEFHITCPKE